MLRYISIFLGVALLIITQVSRAQEKPVITTTNTTAQYTKIMADLESFRSSKDLNRLVSAVDGLEGVTDEPDDISSREKKLELFLRILESVAKETDPKFDPTDLPLTNVAPPNEKYRAGISPESIEDETDRKEYEEAIKKNAKKAAIYRHQLSLQRIKKKLGTQLEKFLHSAYSVQEKQALQQARKEIAKYEIDQDSKKAISDVIDAKLKK